jgi:hypothetical protein
MFCGLPQFGRPCNKDKGKIVEHDDPIRRCRITDALEFYASVREAAKRRVDAAETLRSALSVFFRHHQSETEEPTEKEALRDFKALQHGKHDGKLVIENVKPKMIGGKRKIIDKTFTAKMI